MKKKFTLDEWLKDKSQKIVTRDGKPVKIIYTDVKGSKYPIIALITIKDGQEMMSCFTKDGAHNIAFKCDNDLFFVTEDHGLTKFETLLGEIIDSWENESPFNVPEELKKDAQKLEECLCGIEKGDGPLAWYLGKIAGLEDAMTIIPHWKKCGVSFLYYQILDGWLYHDDWCIPLEDLFNKLPRG